MNLKIKKPIVLCIMDGWGLTDITPGNAVALAQTPNYLRLLQTYPNTTLQASGKAVGLPENQMGNSEVGHMTMGAGRVVYSGLSLINKDVDNQTFKMRKEILAIFNEVKKRKSKLHVMGLLSYGGVHSHVNHLKQFMQAAFENQVPYILHGFSDGRDVSPTASLSDFPELEPLLKQTNGSWGLISGRYYAMDRDRRWERTNLVYDALTTNKCNNRYSSVLDYLQKEHNNKITDEFIHPALPNDFENKTICDNDVVFFFNFRPDRARQLCHLLRGSNNLYDYEPLIKLKNIYLATMMVYEKNIIDNVIYPPFALDNTLGMILEKHNLTQLRIAETEKYPHVTFFFDGGQEIDLKGSKRILVPSQKVATYDLKPEMSAFGITERLLPMLSSHDVIILNYANPDMVGHSGVITATVDAVQTTDKQIGIITQAISSLKGICIITADHGNAEVKLDKNNQPATSHTTNPVPFIITDPNVKLRNNGSLADIAPTILEYLNIPQPKAMTGKSLIIAKK